MGGKNDTYSWGTIAAMAVGFGFFALVLVGLQTDWKAGIIASVIAALAAVAFGAFMRMNQARKQQSPN
jgi:hypothetical protein